MKNTLLAPLFFLFSCLIILSLVLLFVGMDASVALGQAQEETTFSCLIRQILVNLPLLPLVIALSLFFAFVRLRKRPGIRPLTFLLLFAATLGVLLAGIIGLPSLTEDGCLEKSSAILWRSEGIHRLPFREGTTPVLVAGGEGEQLERILIPRGKGDFHLAYFPTGTVTDEEMILKENSITVSIPFRKDHPFGNPGGQSVYLEDFARLGLQLSAQESSRDSIIAAAALVFYLVSCWGFIRISRWNLFNIFLLLMLIRLAGLIFQVFSSDLAAEAAALLPVDLPMNLLPFFALAAAGFTLLLIDFLFIPYYRRIKEEMDE